MTHQAPRPQVDLQRPDSSTPSAMDKPKLTTKTSHPIFLGPILIVLSILIALYLVSALSPLNLLGLNKDSGEWKAVFLSNGQVYFGHTVNEKSDPLVLRDIYYLQATQPLQQADQGQARANLSQNQLPLIKLGNELHGPEDEMRINKEHILFVETLRKDARVAEAIDDFIGSE